MQHSVEKFKPRGTLKDSAGCGVRQFVGDSRYTSTLGLLVGRRKMRRQLRGALQGLEKISNTDSEEPQLDCRVIYALGHCLKQLSNQQPISEV